MGILTDTVLTDGDGAIGAPPLLAEFAEAGILEHADIRTAVRFGQLLREPDETVQLALALTIRALRHGSVCLDLSTIARAPVDLSEGFVLEGLSWPDPAAWQRAVEASPLTTLGPETDEGPRPLRVVDGLVYLERYWLQEEAIRQRLVDYREADPPPADIDRLREGLDALFTGVGLPPAAPDLQRVAAAVSGTEWLTVIAGGPGTGKTTTVAKLLALLIAQSEEPLRIALAAPTGKAAARLTEAVTESLVALPEHWRSLVPPLQAVTLHKLLGYVMHAPAPRHNALNPLPHDLVIVDEMSMVSLTMMDALLKAVRPPGGGSGAGGSRAPGTRLVLIGDPNQLASVEAGAVLADICAAEPPPSSRPAELLERLGSREPDADTRAADAIGAQATDAADTRETDAISARPTDAADTRETDTIRTGGGQVVELTHIWRFRGRLQGVAEAIRVGDAERVVDLLSTPVLDPVNDNARLVTTDVTTNPPPELYEMIVRGGRDLAQAGRAGNAGAALAALNRQRLLCAHRHGPYGVSRWSREIESWLEIRSAIDEWYPGRPVMVTRNDRALGLYNGDTGVVIDTDEGPRVVFTADGPRWAPAMLDGVVTVHAMTIHKAQGSQFGRVAVLLPPEESPLLTRELLYTAVTRAASEVVVFGSAEAVRTAVGRPANRASGLRQRLGR